MGLRIKLASQERVVINGCILRNNSSGRVEIEIENRSDVLRASEMFDENSADTPVKRLCFEVQIALVSREHRDAALVKAFGMMASLRDAIGARKASELDEIEALLRRHEFYAASRKLRALIPYEEMLLSVPLGEREVA